MSNYLTESEIVVLVNRHRPLNSTQLSRPITAPSRFRGIPAVPSRRARLAEPQCWMDHLDYLGGRWRDRAFCRTCRLLPFLPCSQRRAVEIGQATLARLASFFACAAVAVVLDVRRTSSVIYCINLRMSSTFSGVTK